MLFLALTILLVAVFAVSFLGMFVTLIAKNGAIAALIRGEIGNLPQPFLIFAALAFVSLVALMMLGGT